MPPTMNKAQIRRLGERLCAPKPSPSDMELLGALQDEYLGALERVDYALRETLGLASEQLYDGVKITLSNRLKRDRRIVEKLRRGTELDRMQDIVGFRIVGDFTLAQQDDLTREVTGFFGGRVRDRRTDPSYGYRAVHVVTDVDGFLVEVQIRTFFQDLWAQLMEGLSDAWGRAIQYGGPPEGLNEDEVQHRARSVEAFKALSPLMARFEEAQDDVRRAETELEALSEAGTRSPEDVTRRNWLQSHLDELRAALSEAADALRGGLETYTDTLKE